MAQVVDASVAVGWCVRSQADGITERALDSVIRMGGFVPAQFFFEVFHSLVRLERRGVVPRGDVDQLVIRLTNLPLTVDRAYEPPQMAELYLMARQNGLKIYDAAYLELALRLGLPLATRDAALAQAAAAAGVALFGPS